MKIKEEYKYILKNGRVIDPKNGLDEVCDVAISRDGRIAEVAAELQSNHAEKVLDVSGLMVTPGLIDAHTHVYHTTGMAKAWAGDYSIQPDMHSFKSGVTTMVDTGTAGCLNFGHFKETVINRVKTRVLALLNIADYGMSSLMVEQFPESNDATAFEECYSLNSDTIVGIKVAHYNHPDWRDIEYAKMVQKKANVPIMVDFGVFRKERPFQDLLENYLECGDIATHCFRGPVPVVDENEQIYPYLWQARKRGIKFDLGHGAGSFIFRNAVPAIKQGFYPDTISTDLHILSMNTAIDLQSTLSKILSCGDISFFDLFSSCTSNPAKLYHRDDLGNLDVGAEADVAVWSVRHGDFCFADTANASNAGKQRLECEMTFRAGDLVWDLNARSASFYKELPVDYGYDKNKEVSVLPR